MFMKIANSQGMVVGEGIDLLLVTLEKMLQLGAPNVHDKEGFSKAHYDIMFAVYGSVQIDDEGRKMLTENDVIRVMTTLAKYKYTQITNYDELSLKVKQDIYAGRGVEPTPQQLGQNQDAKQLSFKGQDKWGKYILHIPGGYDMRMARRFNAMIRNYCESNGINQTEDQWGKWDYPIWKYFNNILTA